MFVYVCIFVYTCIYIYIYIYTHICVLDLLAQGEARHAFLHQEERDVPRAYAILYYTIL